MISVFWKYHDKALRKGRVLQAAAALRAGGINKQAAVDTAFELEQMVNTHIESQESEKD